MAVLTDTERARIEGAVRDVESRTCCEFVAVLAPSSDGYDFVRWGVPAIVALIAPWPLALTLPLDGLSLLAIQLLIFILLATALQWSPLALWLMPQTIQEDAAARAARAEFQRLGLSRTARRTGVMLFVSEAEHHVEILVDCGIAEKIPTDAWQAVVDRFVADVRRGRLADGFERAIRDCGDVLAPDFPSVAGDRNELPDRLIER